MTDLILPLPTPHYYGLFLELKQPLNYPNDDQKSFMWDMRDVGYAAFWVNSFEDGIDCLVNYTKGKLLC